MPQLPSERGKSQGPKSRSGPVMRLLERLPVPLNVAVARTVERVSALEAAKQNGLARAIARTREEGRKEVAVLLAEQRLAVSKALASGLRSESERLRINEPTCEEGSCVLHGRLVEESGRGVKGWTVAAIGDRGLTIDRRPTGDLGYFELRMTAGEVGRLSRSGRAGVARERRVAGAASPAGGDVSVTIEVTDPHGRVVYRDAAPVWLRAGNVVYHEIRVAAARKGQEAKVHRPKGRRR